MGQHKGAPRLTLPPSFLSDFVHWLDQQDGKSLISISNAEPGPIGDEAGGPGAPRGRSREAAASRAGGREESPGSARSSVCWSPRAFHRPAEEAGSEGGEEQGSAEEEVISEDGAGVPQTGEAETDDEVLDAMPDEGFADQQDSRQARFEFKDTDFSSFMNWLDEFETTSECRDSDPGDPGFLCTYFEEDIDLEGASEGGSASVLSHHGEQAEGQADEPEVLEVEDAVAAEADSVELQTGFQPEEGCAEAAPLGDLDVGEVAASPSSETTTPMDACNSASAHQPCGTSAPSQAMAATDTSMAPATLEPEPVPTAFLDDSEAPLHESEAQTAQRSAASEVLDTRALEPEPTLVAVLGESEAQAAERPEGREGLDAKEAALERLEAPGTAEAKQEREAEVSGAEAAEPWYWCCDECGWVNPGADEVCKGCDTRRGDGMVARQRREEERRAPQASGEGDEEDKLVAGEEQAVDAEASSADQDKLDTGEKPAEVLGEDAFEAHQDKLDAGEKPVVDASDAKALRADQDAAAEAAAVEAAAGGDQEALSDTHGEKRSMPSPPEAEADSAERKWNPYDRKVYDFEGLVVACRGNYTREQVRVFWKTECKAVEASNQDANEAKKPRQTSSPAGPETLPPGVPTPQSTQPGRAASARTFPAPPWRTGVLDSLDWTSAPPRFGDSAEKRRSLALLELETALAPWARSTGAPFGPAMQKALAVLDVRDLQGLRREVNCRILPEKKRTEKKRKKTGQENTEKAKVEAFPLPVEEHSLIGLSERILELERLKQLVCAQVPYEQEYVEVLTRVLDSGADSISALAVKSFDINTKGLGEESTESIEHLRDEAVRQAREDNAARVARRSELVRYGRNPFIATAPHNVFLRRDGCTPHMREDFTTAIAQRLALELEGTAVCWTRLEQWRTETRYALGHRRIATQGEKSTNEALDPTNRDPNYLHVEELPMNPWFCGLTEWNRRCRQDKHLQQLHVDVHGCQNPPVYPTHMVIGLGALRRRADELPEGRKRQEAVRRLVVLADALRESLGPAVAPCTGLEPHEIVTITGAGYEAGCNPPEDFLMGVSSDPSRRTLTQQSVLHVGVSHALQLEISLRLRKLLVGEPKAIDALARALRNCWRQSMEADAGTQRR